MPDPELAIERLPVEHATEQQQLVRRIELVDQFRLKQPLLHIRRDRSHRKCPPFSRGSAIYPDILRYTFAHYNPDETVFMGFFSSDYFPKGSDFGLLSAAQLRRAEQRLNHQPRKCLGYKIPHEVMFHRSSVAPRS